MTGLIPFMEQSKNSLALLIKQRHVKSTCVGQGIAHYVDGC